MTTADGILDASALTDLGAALSQSGVYRSSAAGLRKFRRSLAYVSGGIAGAKLAVLGDSTSAAIPTVGWPSTMRAVMTARGITARQDGGLIRADDARFAIGAGWADGIGNGTMWLNSTTTNPLTLTPVNNVKSFDVYYYDLGTGQFSVQIDAEATTTITCANTSTMKKVTVTSATLGAHTLKVTRVSAGIWIGYVDAYDPAAAHLRVLNLSTGGRSTTDFVPGSYLYQMALLSACNLHMIKLGVNDWGTATALNTYSGNLTGIINGLRANGDCILIVPNAGSVPSTGVIQTYVDTLKSLATSLDLPLLNLQARWGDYTTVAGLSLMADTVHPNATLLADEGRWYGEYLLAA